MAKKSYRQAINEALTQEMERDESVFMIGEDIGQYGGAFGASFGMLEQFGPERILDTPITELGLTGAATGAALVGMIATLIMGAAPPLGWLIVVIFAVFNVIWVQYRLRLRQA